MIPNWCFILNGVGFPCGSAGKESTCNEGDLGSIPGLPPGFLAPRGEEFNPGPETRLDRSELLCNKVLLKHKGDRESF